jgi:ribonuclease I
MPENYHPKICTILTYIFALVYNNNSYKIHGLWPNSCLECKSCNYPTCCQKITNYEISNNNLKFVENYWLDGTTVVKHDECNMTTNKLYEYEFSKHGTCMNKNINDYINSVSELYYKLEKQLDNLCNNNHTCNIVLDNL